MDSVFGIILKVHSDALGDTSSLKLLGKTMSDWVKLALGDAPCAEVNYDPSVELPLLVRGAVDASKAYTAVLYSDAPLLSKKTVVDAIDILKNNGNLSMVKMTRGYIFRTGFLLSCDKLYTSNTHFFTEEDFLAADSTHSFALIADVMRSRILKYHCERGVRILDLGTVYIEGDVKIAAGVEIGPQNILKGATVLRAGVRLPYANVIEDSIVEEGAEVQSSRVYRSYIGERSTVGPFAYIRPDSIIGPDCRIGDFVEIKKSVVGAGSKVSHLSYLGDCEIGDGCNIGCGVVFVNYNGKDKFRTKVGNHAFIGSNSNLIAPLTIEDGAYVAAGSTLTSDVPKGALAIARARQTVKTDWKGNLFAPKE